MVIVSTDGSCLANPGGAIGWAWINHDGTFDSGGAASGTNQIAELTAILQALRAHPGPEPLLIESDSQYAIKCSSEWVIAWKRKGWRTAGGAAVRNLELIRGIDDAVTARVGPVRFRWVRGHVGDPFNERADQLAGIAAADWAAGRGHLSGTLVPELVGAAVVGRQRPTSGTAGESAAAGSAGSAGSGPAPAADSHWAMEPLFD